MNPNKRISLDGAWKVMLIGIALLALVACSAPATPAPTAVAPQATTAAVQPTQPPAAAEKKQIKVTLWTHVSQDEQNWFKSEWAKSAAKNAPDYDAQLEIVALAHGDLHNKVLANMSAGQELPDIMGLTHDFWGRFGKGTIVEDNLAPIDDVIADVQSDAVGLSPWSKDGKNYGIREDIATTGFWYRQDLLKASGVTTPIATWEDLLAAGKSLKAPAKYMMPVVIDNFFLNYPMISQRGNAYWTDDGKFNLNTPEMLEAITYLKKGLDDKVFFPVSQGDFWGSKFFAGGEVIGASMPSWYGTYVLFPAVPDQSGKWQVQNLPKWSNGGHKSSSVWGGTAWVFNKKSPNLDVIKKIAKGMYFDTDARVRYAEISKNLPAYKPALADARVKNIAEPFLGGQQWNQIFFDGLSDTVQPVQSIHDLEIQPILDEGWTNLMAGKITPQAFLDSIDKQIKELGIPIASAK